MSKKNNRAKRNFDSVKSENAFKDYNLVFDSYRAEGNAIIKAQSEKYRRMKK